MKNEASRLLLVLGCQRSGTTLLAAMLGGHSEINMLFESTSDEVSKLIGKKYSGNKLLAWRQVRMNQGASTFGHVLNRLANAHFAGRKHHRVRPFPTALWSVQDYLERKAKIVVIVRERFEVLNSILTRTQMTETQAEKEYQLAMELIGQLEGVAFKVHFTDLVNRPEATLKEVCDFLGLEFEKRMLDGTKYNFVYPNATLLKEKTSSEYDKV